jgi:fluoride exporter
MNHLLGLALGGACGSILRFLVSTGVYQWLGRGFPYGTLTVNLFGSFLLGLLTEALVLQRVAIALEYRTAILVGFIGAFTTFSTFALDTVYLLEQGNISKALVNIFGSVIACVFVVWIGLLLGRYLFSHTYAVVHWQGGMMPYAMLVVNTLIAFLIGLIAATLSQKVALPVEYHAAIMIITMGAYLTLSGLYVVLYLIEHGYSLVQHAKVMLAVLAANTLICMGALWLGVLASGAAVTLMT